MHSFLPNGEVKIVLLSYQKRECKKEPHSITMKSQQRKRESRKQSDGYF
ncbi:hypothetical protein CLOSTHATH_06150 [Hungatella hathewayi DSM 13479]|uniref:Uncharacterized protein n=1 Tax=Hungatella hathewayi DSM 13479 TaxID=566550 RepID=D3AR94_9FIRM|nr:hypothetical protein CLOSTHATH_06150 [Hungatella hathewayi DSM 13479]